MRSKIYFVKTFLSQNQVVNRDLSSYHVSYFLQGSSEKSPTASKMSKSIFAFSKTWSVHQVPWVNIWPTLGYPSYISHHYDAQDSTYCKQQAYNGCTTNAQNCHQFPVLGLFSALWWGTFSANQSHGTQMEDSVKLSLGQLEKSVVFLTLKSHILNW